MRSSRRNSALSGRVGAVDCRWPDSPYEANRGRRADAPAVVSGGGLLLSPVEDFVIPLSST